MTALGKGEKAAQQVALTRARAALKGLGANEIASGAARKRATASTKTIHHAHGAGIRFRRIRLRKIRIRG